MRKFTSTFLQAGIALGLVLLLDSCATKTQPRPQVAELQAQPVILPDSHGDEFGVHGFLVVNTPRELRWDENSVRRLTPSGYNLYTARGHHLYAYVPNHFDRSDEQPTTVLLPCGAYRIETHTPYGRPIEFEVIIRPQTETTINLDPTFPLSPAGEMYCLRLQDRTVGWMSEVAAH